MERVRSWAEPRFSEIRFPLLVGVRSRVRSLFPKVLRVMIPRSELVRMSVLLPENVLPATMLFRELMERAVSVWFLNTLSRHWNPPD